VDRRPRRVALLTVDLPALPDIDHENQQDLVVDLVHDAVVAYPDAP
jgi:hypothetical protein